MKLLNKIPFRFWVISIACLIIFLFSYFRIFNNYELISYDLRLNLRPPLKTSQDIIVIEISDDTLRNLGKWPLPRDFHASLINVLKEFKAKAIIFDILFSEPTLYDEVLSRAISEAGNVYLPMAFYISERPEKKGLFTKSNAILGGICNSLEQYTRGQGHINVSIDPDGKVRRIPLFIEYQGKLFPHLGLKAACDWLALDTKNIVVKKDRVIVDNKLSIPNSANSYFMVNYPDRWKSSFKHLSYFEILKSYSDIKKGIKPKLDLSILKDRVCFIGLTATGTSDLKAIPLENIYPMLGLQASVFNSIIAKRFIRDAGPLTNALINIIIFSLSLIICLRLIPLKAFLISIIIGVGYFFIATGALIFYGVWIDLFSPLFIIGLTYTGSTVYRFLDEARKRQLLEKELDIARAIQKSFLPEDLKEFHGLSVLSFMQPAKFVAGDLYDILTLDDKRAGVFIGDVSGKGVPASLIMAQTISLFRIFSRQYSHCRDVLSRLNQELYGKFEGRFVTCIYMIVDTQKRKIYVSSAGHSPLFIYNKKVNTVSEAALSVELPLGIMEEVKYQDMEFDIENGDMVIAFTDGLLEARNKKCQEFGLDNIKKAILEKSDVPEKILESIKERLFKFSYACSQHDDITLLVISLK